MFSNKTHTGDVIVAGELRLVPIARSSRLKLGRCTLVWNRAVGLRVEAGDGEISVPIRDRTRQLQLAILGLALAGSIIPRLLASRRRSAAKQEMRR